LLESGYNYSFANNNCTLINKVQSFQNASIC
jgi:hypothetical protein